MPELPDLQHFSANLTRKLSGQHVVGAIVHSAKSLNGDVNKFQTSISKKKLMHVSRHGKELVFTLDDGVVFSVHLMLKGFVSLEMTAASKPKITLQLSNDTLSMHDPMNWAKVTFPHVPSTVPDPLSKDFTIEYLTKQLKVNANKPVKTFLITQSEVLGIGNAYADEIMWAARIAPRSLCGSLPPPAIEALHKNSRSVMEWAIGELQKLVPEAISGEERSFLIVHRKDRPKTPFGVDIETEKIGDKTTYSTKEQVLYK